MWFIFGFITLVSFSLYTGYKRINAAWKGDADFAGSITYQYKVLRGRYGITGLLVGIEGPAGYDYSFKKETLIDRFFKFVGLSREFQAGNKEFDQLIYVVSDNAQLHRQVTSNTQITDAAVKAFKLAEKYHCKATEIRHNSSRLWVKFKTTRGFDEGEIAWLAAELTPLLKTITDELERAPLSLPGKWRDPFVIKSIIILAISSGLAINGLIQLLRLNWIELPFTVDAEQLLMDSVYWGAGIVFTLLLSALVMLGRSARTHLVMLELIFIGSFGAVSTTAAELRDINIELDESRGLNYEVKALDKKITRSRRSTRYYLYVDDWNKAHARKKVKVPSDIYYSVEIGDDLLVRQRKGFLNYRWVESLAKKT